MDMYSFWMKAGTARTEKVAKMAGTTMAYARHIIKCRKCPRPELAQRLVDASIKESLDHQKKDRLHMTRAALLKTPSELAARRIELLGRQVPNA